MTDEENDKGVDVPITVEESSDSDGRKRIEAEAERVVEEFDKGVVDVLSWLLDTDTKARIYVYLRAQPESTSEEIAEGTGLYPSTVREALAELHDETIVTRQKRPTEGTGNKPYEYQSIPPSELIQQMVGQVQKQFRDVLTLDRSFESDDTATDVEPITIRVDPDEGDEDEGEGLETRGDEE